MTLANPVLYLPLFHQELGMPCSFGQKAQYIWTGLSRQETANAPQASTQALWRPTNYPFGEKEAEACLHDIKSMGEAALSGVPLQAVMSMQSPHEQFQRLEEQSALENLIATGQQAPSSSQVENIYILRTAQKFLLWTWLMEEYILDLQDLTQKYAANSSHILEALGVEHDDALAGLGHIQRSLADSYFVLPPWRLVLENMAPFLPEKCTAIINNKDMIDALLQLPNTSLVSAQLHSDLGLKEGCNASQCTVTIKDILQKNETQQEHAPWLHKELHCILLHNEDN